MKYLFIDISTGILMFYTGFQIMFLNVNSLDPLKTAGVIKTEV